MQRIEIKLVAGTYTYGQALKLVDDGWRVPTIFELKVLVRSGFNVKDCWSASPCKENKLAACLVVFDDGYDNAYFKILRKYVCLVRESSDFDYMHAVSRKELVEFDQSRSLPDWHRDIPGRFRVEN